MKPLITEIALVASKYRSAIILETETGMIDAKSIMGMFTSFVGVNPNIIHIQGADAEQAKAELTQLFKQLNVKVQFKLAVDYLL